MDICRTYGKQRILSGMYTSIVSIVCIVWSTIQPLNTTPACTLCNDRELSIENISFYICALCVLRRLVLHGVTGIHFLGNVFSFRISELLRDVRHHRFRTLVLYSFILKILLSLFSLFGSNYMSVVQTIFQNSALFFYPTFHPHLSFMLIS